VTDQPAPAPPVAFRLTLTAEPQHIDELGHVNNAVWVQWIQQVATAHWFSLTGSEEQGRFIWVVVRHEIDYRRPLLAGQAVTAETWVADKAAGARFARYMRFVGADGAVHVEAKTDWALLDRASGRPQRVLPEMAARFRADP
jgi:acyl-CoA thioester hydrolase